MKKINLFSRLWSSGGNSQSSDVGYDSRLTVGSPSGFNSKLMLKLVSVLAILLTVGVGNVWGQAAVGTAMWAEDFSGYSANDVPSGSISNSHTGTTVYNGSVTYSCSGNGTKVYTSGGPGTDNNLLIYQNNGTFVVSGIPIGGATELTLSYRKSGSGTMTITCSSNVSISGSTISVTSGTTFDLTFKNTKSNKNLRFDDVSVVVKTAGVSESYTVSFSTGAGNDPVSARTEASAGAGITLPSTSDLTPNCSGDGWVLYGWATAAYGSSSTTTAPTTTLAGLAGATYYPAADITLYAVYRKPEGLAGTTMWSENFTGESADDQPTGPTTGGGTKYGAATVTYACGASYTKVYANANAGGTSPELLVPKSSRSESFAVSGIPSGGETSFTLTYKTNQSGLSVTSGTTGVTVGDASGTNPYSRTITLNSSSITSFGLTFAMSTDNNARLDDISLVVDGTCYYWSAPTCAAATNFTNGATVFIQADSKDYSAWKDDACVKAWFNASGAGGAAQTTYWLFDATDTDAGKKLFAAVVPASGDLNQVTVQRFAEGCGSFWNNNGTLTKASASGVNTFHSYGSADNNIAWNGSSTTLSLYGSQNSWGSSLATFADQGAGEWTATINNYAPDATSKDYKIKTSYNNGWIGNTGSNNNATLSGMIVGSTYNVTATLDVTDHSLVMSKEFVKGEVSFDLQGHGDAISKLTNVTAGSKIVAPSAPTASGWRFAGWYKEDACTNEWNFASDEVEETMTLYAKWVQTFTVTYNANGGSSTMTDSNSPYDTGSTVTVLSNSFTAPTGKEFNHWDTKDDDTGIDYTAGNTFTISANTTLYAQWSIADYNVTYSTPSNGNYTISVSGGSATSATKTANYNQTISIVATPSSGYGFGSWTITNTSTSADVTSTLLTGDKPTTASTSFTMPDYGVTITATFKQEATVKLSVVGSESVVVSDGLEGDSYTLPSTAADCPDVGLYGWYKGSSYYHATTAPSGANFYLPGATATLTGGENKFYAVYATVTPDAANTYTKITTTEELVTGDYLLVAYFSASYIEAMQNTVNASGYMNEVNVNSYVNNTTTPTKVTLESDNSAIRWRITKSTSTITIYNAAVSKYFCGSTGTPALNTTSEDFSYSVTSGNWTLVTNSKTVYYSSQWYVGTPSSAKEIYLFKRDPSIAGPYTTSPSCVTHDLDVVADPVVGGTATAVQTVLGEGKTTTAEATPNSHYTFSYWTISGTGSTMSNTVDNKSTDNPVTVTMGTEDATLTAHFVEKEKCTVVFKNNGVTKSSTTYWRGENPVAPTLTDGTDHDACDETSDTHYGWTQTAWQNTLEQAAIDAKTAADVKVYAKDATLPAITAGDDGTTITYHAVWAKVTGGVTTISIDGDGLQAVVKDQTSGYGAFDFSVGGYTFHVSAATKCSDSGAAKGWFQLKKNNEAITIPTLPGKITNISSTAIRTATSGSVSTGVYFNSSATTSAAIASETLSSATSFSLDVTGNNSSGYLLFGAATCINQLSVTYSTASYSKYLTTCCEYIVDAPTVTGTPTKNSITLSWTNVTGATGYTVTSSGGTPGDVTSDGTARSCVITGLSPNTNYTWSVVATYTTPYCDATTANGNTTTSQVYAVSYNKNGGAGVTVSPLPASANYAAGETVTVAAKPGTTTKGGYNFTGWNTQADGLGTHYDADGTKSFTMPAAPVTLYAEWTAKKYYYVDRMHGNSDGVNTIEIGGVNYGCYIGEAQHTTPDPSDNSTGSNSCITGHSHFLGWVISTSIGAQGQLVNGYTIIAGGTEVTAGVDGRIYYAVWAEE